MSAELDDDTPAPRKDRWQPVTTVEQLQALDSDLIVSGYMAGFKNSPDYTRRDQAYWHGYLNGQVDGGFMQPSAEQGTLARAVAARGHLRELARGAA